jgi:hypothetical protein
LCAWCGGTAAHCSWLSEYSPLCTTELLTEREWMNRQNGAGRASPRRRHHQRAGKRSRESDAPIIPLSTLLEQTSRNRTPTLSLTARTQTSGIFSTQQTSITGQLGLDCDQQSMTPSNIRVLLPRPTVLFGIASILILLVSPFEKSINGEAIGHPTGRP